MSRKPLQNAGAIGLALLAAALYALSAPLSKLLLQALPPAMTAAYLYLGAGAGMLLLGLARKCTGREPKEQRLVRADWPYAFGMVLLDVAAPILLMHGLTETTAANAALLNNFEIVATALIALFLFHERVSGRLFAAIGLITLASALLSLSDAGSLSFSKGSLFVLLAAVCWGLENNCTRAISGKDPAQIVIVKGFGSGAGALAVALLAGERFSGGAAIPAALLLGFVAYGLSIFFYVRAQRALGAARTSAYYALAPFIGAGLSLLIFGSLPGGLFLPALAIMAAGTYFASTGGREKKEEAHVGVTGEPHGGAADE